MTSPVPAVDRLRVATDAFVALQPAVEAGAPWALTRRHGVQPEASWGPPEPGHLESHIGQLRATHRSPVS